MPLAKHYHARFGRADENDASKCPIVLVGLQTDLRTDATTLEKIKRGDYSKEGSTSVIDGQQLAKRIDALQYVECSARDVVCGYYLTNCCL